MENKYTERPALESYTDTPLFNTKAVTRKTGIAAPTLRAWERRYTILSPERSHNAYRLYSERDIALLGWLKDRVDAGMSISQAIALHRYLEEEYHQVHQKDVRSESISPAQGKIATVGTRKHAMFAGGDEQKKDETYSWRFVQEQLLDAFNRLDEAVASQWMASMLAIYSVEQVCTELVAPTLWEIGRLWEQGLLSVSIEHFASAFFHGWLTNLLRTMPTSRTSPLVITCCAPGELHELAPLMLALLLRRGGLHVAYLGQNIESASLLQTVKQVSPALICVSVTLISYLEAVAELGQKVQELPPPRPALVFGGQAFKQRPDLITQIPGIYVEGDMQTIVAQLRRTVFQQVDEKQ
jgi:DNA-binding transcriptional MerR regulator/methylmalonyl-CoA mutase cobalamin-binding subunit